MDVFTCLLLDFIYLILERKEGREKERERNIYVRKRERNINLLVPQMGTEPAMQAYALTGNRTGDLLLCGMTPNQLSRSGHGWI